MIGTLDAAGNPDCLPPPPDSRRSLGGKGSLLSNARRLRAKTVRDGRPLKKYRRDSHAQPNAPNRTRGTDAPDIVPCRKSRGRLAALLWELRPRDYDWGHVACNSLLATDGPGC